MDTDLEKAHLIVTYFWLPYKNRFHYETTNQREIFLANSEIYYMLNNGESMRVEAEVDLGLLQHPTWIAL